VAHAAECGGGKGCMGGAVRGAGAAGAGGATVLGSWCCAFSVGEVEEKEKREKKRVKEREKERKRKGKRIGKFSKPRNFRAKK
jgi:hypothetical protein